MFTGIIESLGSVTNLKKTKTTYIYLLKVILRTH